MTIKERFQSLTKRQRTVGLLFISISVICMFFLATRPKEPIENPSPLTPSPAQASLLNSYPPNGVFALTFPTTALSYTFNLPITQSQFRIDINPNVPVETSLSTDKKTLYAKPQGSWKLNVPYTITLVGTGQTVVEEKRVTFVTPSQVEGDEEEETPGGI